jgi:hypothetical protein
MVRWKIATNRVKSRVERLPVEGAVFLAALEASCFRGAFPPVDFRAVCLVRAIVRGSRGWLGKEVVVENVNWLVCDEMNWEGGRGRALRRLDYYTRTNSAAAARGDRPGLPDASDPPRGRDDATREGERL